MQIIPNRKIWFSLSGALVGLSLLALLIWGLKPGIDFTGGSLLEVKFANDPPSAREELGALFETLTVGAPAVQQGEGQTLVLRFAPVTEEKHQEIIGKIRADFPGAEEARFSSIGPSVGKELFRKSLVAVFLVALMILGYLAWSFRKVSRPIASWKYGLIVIVAFLHDVIIPLGLFSLLGYFKGWEVGSSFIAAILTILGYSIADTIVVLDRVRENLKRVRGTFEEVVEVSVHQTITRSVNTSATTMMALLAIFFFGGASLRDFSLALLIGIFFGTYSSIFIAAPLLVTWYRWQNRR
ncbi:protein translocase subunit SecF [Candidatus Uhrbacteria bacterium]|nr:protein translocase subunit SecF [Candidatus Uhrbacteria bacterium]